MAVVLGLYFLGVPSAKSINESAICDVLSEPRSTTYIHAAGGDKAEAMELYGWNARIAAAFMLPSHFAEVCTRNAAADALTAIYGDRWLASHVRGQLALAAAADVQPAKELGSTPAIGNRRPAKSSRS